MPTLAENPTQFLVELRKKVKELRRFEEKAADTIVDRAKLLTMAKEVVAKFEDLDEWLEDGGDAPEQWVEKKPEF